MIKMLVGLASINQGGQKRINVWAINNDNATNATLKFIVCDVEGNVTVALQPNEEKQVAYTHQESGQCLVVVEDVDSQERTEKILDLDASESS